MPIVLNGSTGVISASSLSGISTGKILQVIQAVKTDSQSFTSSGSGDDRFDITGLSAAITPSSHQANNNTSNRIFYSHQKSNQSFPLLNSILEAIQVCALHRNIHVDSRIYIYLLYIAP